MKNLPFLFFAISLIIFVSCSDSGTGPDSDGGNEATRYDVVVNVNPSGAGTISPSADSTYDEGSSVNMSATAADGYRFTGWTGGVESTDNPLSLTVDQDYSLTAIFELKSYELTVNTDGEGTVSEKVVQQPSKDYDHGTTVELTASPADGYKFVEWKGDVTGTDNPVQITVDQAKEVTAVFTKKSYSLTVNTDGQGAVSEKELQTKVTNYEFGAVVELTANPSTGYKFSNWKGDLTGISNPAQITVDQAKKVTAVFTKKSYALTVNTSGNGSVAKNPDQTTYEYDSTVELEAMPADGHQFKEWTGAIASTENPVEITINEEKQVTAVFEERPPFYLASNGVTIKCEDASVGDTGTVNGVTYTKRTEAQITITNAETSCTSGITDMSGTFGSDDTFNGDISHWDVSSVRDMSSMFFGATSFNRNISSWDVSNVVDMSEMFYEATSFNKDLTSWDVSKVTKMSRMFERNGIFNGDISSWDVSSVTDMSNMFYRASAFSGDLSNWNVSNVIEMGEMFSEASSFNSDISGWNVSKVTDMGDMFYGATSFNRDLTSWDVSSVTDMRSMFTGATSFNGNISGWNVGNVEFMSGMFENADDFNGNIGSWDVGNVTSMNSIFKDAASFNQDISNWCVSNFSSEPSNFSDGSPLINDHKPDWGTCPGS